MIKKIAMAFGAVALLAVGLFVALLVDALDAGDEVAEAREEIRWFLDESYPTGMKWSHAPNDAKTALALEDDFVDREKRLGRALKKVLTTRKYQLTDTEIEEASKFLLELDLAVDLVNIRTKAMDRNLAANQLRANPRGLAAYRAWASAVRKTFAPLKAPSRKRKREKRRASGS